MAWSCGDVAWVDPDPSLDHEQRKRRPVVVVSNNKFNSRCSLTMVVPITSTDSGYPLRLDVGEVPSESGGRSLHGWVEVEQLKSLDLASRNAVRVGKIDASGMDKILGLLLGCLISPDMSVISNY